MQPTPKNTVNIKKYLRSKAYREIVDATLFTISYHLDIPFHELYNGLFFHKGEVAKGLLVIRGEFSESDLTRLRKEFYKTTGKEN